MENNLTGIPSQSMNQADAMGSRSASEFARKIVQFHRDGLKSRRYMDLTAEKYAIHLDGEGDGQWADLFDGQRIVIPQAFPGQMRVTENLLRPIVDNAVAYHTTMPFRFVVEAKPDREAKARAVIDQALVNYMAGQQRWNRAFAEAMYIAMVAGNCPIHAFWRDDLTTDPYDPVGYGATDEMQGQIRKGLIDTFVGDPWDTVYNAGAKRNSRHQMTWGRTVPLSVLASAFPQAADLKGSKRLPSASRWQRTMRSWTINGLETHGSASMKTHRSDSGEELIALLCQEMAPGIDAQYPQGRITLVALQGSATVSRHEEGSTDGQAVVLHDGPLPASRFSSVQVYSANRFDDIHGKPFVGDLDDLQVGLNQALSARAEYLRRSVRPPLIDPGIVNDTAVWEDDSRLEMDPTAQTMPSFLQLKVDAATLNRHIEELRNAMFTIGGYQAASRGEANAGDAASKVKFLAEADDTIHGPTNQRFREAVEEFARLNHALFREYGDIPWLVDISGSEYAHLTDSWIDRNMVSQEDPSIKLVSGFGATIASKVTELSNLVTTAGSDGQPLMTTRQFRAAYPDQSTYPNEEDPQETRERHAKVIVAKLRKFGGEMEQQMGEMAMDPMFVAAMHSKFTETWPILPDDDPMAHFDALSSITQDDQESALTRKLAAYRQATYQMWLQGLGMIPPSMIPMADPMQDMAQSQAGPQLVGGQPQQQQQPPQPPPIAPTSERPGTASTPGTVGEPPQIPALR